MIQKEHNANLLQKGATTTFQPDAESSVEAIPRLVQDLTKLAVTEQSSQNRFDSESEVNRQCAASNHTKFFGHPNPH